MTARFARLEARRFSAPRWQRNATLILVKWLLVAGSRGLCDALARRDSPRLELRSARAGEAPSSARKWARASGAATCQAGGLAQRADSLAKIGGAATAPLWQCIRGSSR